MASPVVIAAVAAKIGGSTWTSSAGVVLPVRGLNLGGETPADGSAFIEITYPVTIEQQRTTGVPGSNLWLETGTIRIIVNQRRTVGLDQASAWMDELRALFRGQMLNNDVECLEVSGPSINDSNDLGNYWQMSVVVSYRVYAIG